MKINAKRKLFWIILWIFEIYIFSYFLFLKPCENINRCPISEVDLQRSCVDYPEIYPLYTLTCVSENKQVNQVAYCAYWPLNKLIELKGFWYFVKDPSVELTENGR